MSWDAASIRLLRELVQELRLIRKIMLADLSRQLDPTTKVRFRQELGIQDFEPPAKDEEPE
jgi:hypothetical protein